MKILRLHFFAFMLLFSLAPDVQAQIMMQHYLMSNNTKEIEWYLDGYLDAMLWANASLDIAKQPTLFCIPDKLALTTSNLKQVVENYYDKTKATYQSVKDLRFGSIAFFALKEAFPCK